MQALEVGDYAVLRAAGTPHLLLDVRNADEIARCSLPDFLHIPVAQLGQRLAELEPWRDQPIYCLCHHGGRSRMAQTLLLRHGFQAININGGIDAWARQVDPGMVRY